MIRWLAFDRWSLGAKLAATFAAVISLVVLVVSLWVISRSRSALEHELRERGADAAQNLSRLGADLVLEEDLWGLYEVVRDLVVGGRTGEDLVVYAAVADPDGRVLAHSDPASHPLGEPIADDVALDGKGYRPGVLWSIGTSAGERVHHFAAPVIVDGQQVATARVGISLRELEATLSRTSREIVVLGILLQWLGALLGYLVARRMIRPLTELGLAVDRIAAGQLDPPTIATREKDEIGALADRFNLMAHRLRESQRRAVEAQERLIRSERLASVGECAGSLAHEIRNPLGAVVAAARMLSSRAPQASTYDRERLAGVIADEARRLSQILSDFLAFARPRPPARQPHSMNALVLELLELLRLDDLSRGKTLEGLVGEEGRPCEMDRDQVKQVLWNLLRNALEATPAGGRVTVRTLAHATSVDVEVADDGAGIPPERQGRVFEPFFTTRRSGSGLGLAIAHRIVSAHGGAIGLTGAPGEGTRVTVTLPLRASAPGEDAAA